MIMFLFKVNKSFLKYVNHPITIPRKYENVLERDILNNSRYENTDITIISPTGKKLAGFIYAGKAGYGKYYQIKVSGQSPSDNVGDYKLGEVLSVLIEKDTNNIVVRTLLLDTLKKYLDSNK